MLEKAVRKYFVRGRERSGYTERRQDMVPDIVSELMQAMDMDKDGVVNMCDFMAWSRLHSVGAFVEDYCSQRIVRKDEEMNASKRSASA